MFWCSPRNAWKMNPFWPSPRAGEANNKPVGCTDVSEEQGGYLFPPGLGGSWGIWIQMALEYNGNTGCWVITKFAQMILRFLGNFHVVFQSIAGLPDPRKVVKVVYESFRNKTFFQMDLGFYLTSRHVEYDFLRRWISICYHSEGSWWGPFTHD